MSATSADPAAPDVVPARGTGAATVVGIALVLMILAGVTAWLIASRGGPIDGAQLLQSTFGVRTVGPGYAIVEARELAGGARLIILEDGEAPPEPEPARRTIEEDRAKQAEPERVEWSRVSIPSTTTRPRRVVFLLPSEGASHAVVDEFFRKVERRSLLDLGPEGGKVTIASGKLGWRGFDADWVHERVFERGGTFRDGMRVDLSVEKLPCVMTAEWTRGEPASRAALDALLAELRAG